jgi:predicted outer membrane repeat protein
MFFLACSSPEPLEKDSTVTTWSESLTLKEDTVVAEGQTLVVEAGVTVTLKEGVALIVQGELQVLGTEAEPVVFTGSADAPWRSIVFEKTATSAEFEEVDKYRSGSTVQVAVIEYATMGMEIEGVSPFLYEVRFQNNELPSTLDTIGGAALLIRDGANPRIQNCSFENNIANTFAFGGAIYVHHADPILQDNHFTGNFSSYGGAISTDWMASPIVGSSFSGNDTQSEGGAISLVSSVSALINNTVTGNHAKTDGGGIHICLTCDPHAAPYLLDNVVTDNSSDNEDPDEGAAGIGAAFLGIMADNTVYGNLRAGQPSDFGWFNLSQEEWPEWVASPDLSLTWWGTTELEQVQSTVWDGSDTTEFRQVLLEPLTQSSPSGPIPRAVISSRRMLYQDAGEEVPVFLTVYNPSTATTVSL